MSVFGVNIESLLESIGIDVLNMSVTETIGEVPSISMDGLINLEKLAEAERIKTAPNGICEYTTFLLERAPTDEYRFLPHKMLKNGPYLTVLWNDGTRTTVKRGEDEPDSDYAAFTAALGIKIFGSNSALKRVVAGVEEQKKKKKKEESDGNPGTD